MSTVNDFGKNKAFLIDMTKCTGCRGCQVACKQWNQLEAENTEFFSGEGYENPPAMSEFTFTRIKFRDYERNGQSEFAFYKEMCMHCNDAACVSVCPVAAFVKTPEGPVIYKTKTCIGCRFCMIACPFGVPKYEWSKAFPLVRKCTGCYSRVKEGLKPACVTTCPTAITYGPREEMIKEAERRLSAYPDRYLPKVYGKDEAGGTCVIYLTALPFDELGFKPVTMRALPSYTWQALRLVPGIFIGVGATLSAISWFQHRKERVQNEQAGMLSAMFQHPREQESQAQEDQTSQDVKEDQRS
ncbi:4Fe-4S dicluster domain-containing protein [Geoalkalibacter halelectricus]|uniref:4Fe-4S dicluster domain-containing protein n=2 Tax=Geoalkalibacter halelectricus TaxID=2847045 RepID=A0ABY5ZMC8_9BACT|nr:4Fe-4S dicluster domain-containing protein [Geoalkalibacter halelectricus]MDO3377235.1 4Fe-4S dicluster domain-containing protein [Geoalkalibacter halelectricus]UWZ78874.1 4Fe-4S dicluster domain-containing protein [Geoalkalibacter halelectricus]